METILMKENVLPTSTTLHTETVHTHETGLNKDFAKMNLVQGSGLQTTGLVHD
jgi:hypothetical protein